MNSITFSYFPVIITFTFCVFAKSFLVSNNFEPSDDSYPFPNGNNLRYKLDHENWFFLPWDFHHNNSKCYLNIASSRIVNPESTNQEFPWMAFLLTQEEKKPQKQKDMLPSQCTGAVISSRYYEKPWKVMILLNVAIIDFII